MSDLIRKILQERFLNEKEIHKHFYKVHDSDNINAHQVAGPNPVSSKKLPAHAWDEEHADPHEYRQYIKNDFGADVKFHKKPGGVMHMSYHGNKRAVDGAVEDHLNSEKIHKKEQNESSQMNEHNDGVLIHHGSAALYYNHADKTRKLVNPEHHGFIHKEGIKPLISVPAGMTDAETHRQLHKKSDILEPFGFKSIKESFNESSVKDQYTNLANTAKNASDEAKDEDDGSYDAAMLHADAFDAHHNAMKHAIQHNMKKEASHHEKMALKHDKRSTKILDSYNESMNESFSSDKEYSALARVAGSDSIKASESNKLKDHLIAANSHLVAVQKLHHNIRGFHVDSGTHDKIELHHNKIAEHLNKAS